MHCNLQFHFIYTDGAEQHFPDIWFVSMVENLSIIRHYYWNSFVFVHKTVSSGFVEPHKSIRASIDSILQLITMWNHTHAQNEWNTFPPTNDLDWIFFCFLYVYLSLSLANLDRHQNGFVGCPFKYKNKVLQKIKAADAMMILFFLLHCVCVRVHCVWFDLEFLRFTVSINTGKAFGS